MNRYKMIIHAIQALRRRAELLRCPVLGAAGVRAFCYPHQLYIARTVLEHTQIRHLLADEVGLGKTLESLMIMHVLRIRNGNRLRVNIVVGTEKLAKQWREEIYGRFPFPFWKRDYWELHPELGCNNNVFFKDSGEGRPSADVSPFDGFRIFHRDNFDETKNFLDAEHCDLLILDEIHSFGDALLGFLASRAADYRHLLILSATPLLGDEKDRFQLLNILDPDKSEWLELSGRPVDVDSIPLLRSRRRDFPKALPQREPKIIKVKPLENDRERFKKSRNLLQKMLKDGELTEENAALFVRRATIGGQTLIDRVDEYRRQYPHRAGELTEIRGYCSAERGDPRFDALIDYLIEFFSNDVDDGVRKLIIAAQDNPTIDYLEKNIKRCLPGTEIMMFRQERKLETRPDAETDAIEREKATKGLIERFWTGDAQILIAHNDARESYNLQIADALVFYSLPWNLIDMEQWIGRVSRLGLRKPKTVEIVAIVLRDLIDERIAKLYQSLNMFEEPLDIEKFKDFLDSIAKNIRRVVLYGDQIVEPKLAPQEWSGSLIHVVPKDAALTLDDHIQNNVLEPPIKISTPRSNRTTFPKEESLANWLTTLEQHEFCSLRIFSDDNYKHSANRKHYDFRIINNHVNCRKIPILEGEPLSTIPFVLERKFIQLPPRSLVPISKGHASDKQRYEVPLQFFNFGSPLHDGLVDTFSSFFKTSKYYKFSVQFDAEQFDDDTEVKPGTYLIGISMTERLWCNHPNLLDELQPSENKTLAEMRHFEQRRLETGLQSDDRFLELLLPGRLVIHGFLYDREKWERVPSKRFYDFLITLPQYVFHSESQDIIPENCLSYFTEAAKKSTFQGWQQDFQTKLKNRFDILAEEFRVRREVLELKIREQQRKIDEETNEQTVRLNYEPVKKRLEEQLTLAERHLYIRKRYLQDNIDAVKSPQCQCKAVIQITVQITGYQPLE